MEVFIDIETCPEQPELVVKTEIAKSIQHPATIKKELTIADWHNGAGKYVGEKEAAIEDAYRKTGLSGNTGEVISVCIGSGLDRESGECGYYQ